MGNLRVVSKDLGPKFWTPPQNFTVFSRQALCPVAFGELEHACHLAPIFFIKEDDNAETFIPILLLSPIPEQNLFIGPKGEWLVRDLPWAFKAFPFSLGKTPEGSYVLLIDEEYLLDTPNSKAFPLFQEDGNLAPKTAQIAQFLLLREKGYAQCRELATFLGQIELLTPYSIVLDFGGKKKKIEGLYRLDTQKFSALDDKIFLELRQNQALHLIYAHLFSLTNLPYLLNWLEVRQKLASLHQSKVQTKKNTEPSNFSQVQDLEEILKEIKFPALKS
ncbi:MAG: SapC family protein [Desulfurococcaceae archaeon]